ncbi:MAG: choice-of-anchor Q domain-containing protein [Acidobacteriota bacterium]
MPRPSVLTMMLCLMLAAVGEAQYVVNSTLDERDLVPGDGACLTASGVCTLRAAIQDANVAPGLNTVTVPAGVFRLTISGTGEDDGATGDLDVTQDLIIEGVRSVSTIIDAAGLDRVVDHRGGTLRLRRVTIRGGAAEHGGGVRSAVPTLIVEDSVIRDNMATGTGGGLFLSYPAQITRTTVALNHAGTEGGGIYAGVSVPSGLHEISNTTISTNQAGTRGAGLSVATAAGAGSGAVLLHVTLHLNAAPEGASVFTGPAASTTLRNTIVSAGASNCAGAGTIADEGGNLAATPCGSVPVSAALFDSIETLALYHPPITPGPSLGHGLAASSPAIGLAASAFCPGVDQRGIPRPEGGSCDSGAFEFSPANGPYNPSPASLRLSPIGDQVIRVGTSTHELIVRAFDGVAPLEQLVLSGVSSNPALVSPGGIRITRLADGVWSVRAFATPFGTGTVLIQLRAVSFAPDDQASSSFALTLSGADGGAGGGTPAAGIGQPPGAAVATPSGAGTVLTWPASGAPGLRQYAVTGGRTAGGTSLPVLLTSGTETTMTLPSLPAGTYAFRVYAIGAHGVTAPSADAAASVGSAEAPGPPFGVAATAVVQAVEVTGRAPAFGGAPSAFRVEFGSTPGASNVASVMPTAAPFQQPLGNGLYWVQARALAGALVGVPSSTFAVRVGPVLTGCNEAPLAPILLPASTTGPTMTLTWLPSPTGPVASTFVLERLSGPIGLPLEVLNLTTQATVHVADLPAGTHYFRVAGRAPCGIGQFSNLVAVVVGGAP